MRSIHQRAAFLLGILQNVIPRCNVFLKA